MWRAQRKVANFYLLGTGMALLFLFVNNTAWQPGLLHVTTIHIAISILASLLGAVALTQYYYHKESLLLYSACGYIVYATLGWALIPLLANNNQYQILWANWTMNSALALMLVSAWGALYARARRGRSRLVPEKNIYVLAVLVIGIGLMLMYNSSGPAPLIINSYLTRPEALGSAVIFIASIVGFIKMKRWRNVSLEYWLLLSLIIHAGANLLFLSCSQSIYSLTYLSANTLSFIATMVLLGGLFFHQYHALVKTREQLFRLNKESLRNRSILENIADGVVSLDENYRIQSINHAFSGLFQYSEREILGKSISILLPDPFPTLLHEFVKDSTKKNQTRELGVNNELVGYNSEYECFPIHVTVSKMYIEGKLFINCVVRDVSEKKLIEELIIESEKRFRGLFDAAPISILMFEVDDENTLRLYGANKAASRAFGMNLTLHLSKNFEKTCPQFAKTSLPQFYKRIARESDLVDNRPQFYIDEQNARVYESYAFQTTINKVVVLLSDVTERHHAERIKDEFISTVSQELQVPLTSIRSSLGLLTGGAMGEIPDKIRNFIDVAHNNSERLLILINDILDITRIESGDILFNFEHTALDELINSAVKENTQLAKDLKVKLESNTQQISREIFIDRRRLLQAINQIINNAIIFSSAEQEVHIGVTEMKGFTRIFVTDHGQGIADSYKSKIFSKFSQADAIGANHVGGTGLGLCITRAIVERHQGRINFTSKPGQGSCFYIDIPQLSNTSGDEHINLPDDQKILVLDNESNSHFQHGVLLTELGYKPVHIAGTDTLKEYRSTDTYHAILINFDNHEGRLLEHAQTLLNTLLQHASVEFMIILGGLPKHVVNKLDIPSRHVHVITGQITRDALYSILIKDPDTACTPIQITKSGDSNG